MEKYHCDECGRVGVIKKHKGKNYCLKHYEQIIKNGFCLDNNQRCVDDSNEIIKHDKYAEIILYDDLQEDSGKRALIDLEDIDKVKNIHWDKKQKCVVGKINNKEVLLQNYILNTDEKIDFVSEDSFDCRRINLYLVKNTKKRRSNTLVSKKNKGKIIVEFVGRSKSQVTSSAIMISYPISTDKYERILCEFGQSQTNKSLYEEYCSNKEVVQNVVSYDNIKATFICHSHL